MVETDKNALFSGMNRIVIKIGSALLCDASHAPRQDFIMEASRVFSQLRGMGKELVIVSSGAIAYGAGVFGGHKPTLTLEQQQAAASIGQPRLMRAWRKALEPYDIAVAQILLTLDDEARFAHHAHLTIETLWQGGIIPIVNENDAIASDEIRLGDNDRLAAHVAELVRADALWLLSDVDGFYDKDPHTRF